MRSGKITWTDSLFADVNGPNSTISGLSIVMFERLDFLSARLAVLTIWELKTYFSKNRERFQLVNGKTQLLKIMFKVKIVLLKSEK